MAKYNNNYEMWAGRTEDNDQKAVELLDNFTKAFCINVNISNATDDLTFRCKECPFEDGDMCRVKEFKNKFAPDYKDFGAMGDL